MTALTDEFESLKREERPQTSHMVIETKYSRENTCCRCKRTDHRRQSYSFRSRLFCSHCGRDGVLSRSCDCHSFVEATNNNGDKDKDLRYHISISINGLRVNALIDTGLEFTMMFQTIEYVAQNIYKICDKNQTKFRVNIQNLKPTHERNLFYNTQKINC